MIELNFNPFPELYTERLHLRQIMAGDLEEFFELRSDPQVMQYIGRPLAKTQSEVQKLMDVLDDSLIKNNGITWAITLKEENKLVGTIGFWKIEKDNHRAEIGYLLHPKLHGKGIMQEAILKALDFGFDVMNLHSVEGLVSPSNLASIKLLERNKFIQEAYFKENFYFNGKFLDSAVYSLLKSVHTKIDILI